VRILPVFHLEMMDRFVQRSRPAGQARQPLTVASSNSTRRDANERPSKKQKVGHKKEVRDSDAESSEYGDSDTGHPPRRSHIVNSEDGDGLAAEPSLGRVTEVESALPSIDAGKDAIEEYETLRASQVEQEDAQEQTSNTEPRKWVRGKSSIYVDAFNLALDTVLEDETHLFDDKERRAFDLWRVLDYEAQYLYLLYASLRYVTEICANGPIGMCAYFFGRQHHGIESNV
jgi:Fanconi-associated nuclease 1